MDNDRLIPSQQKGKQLDLQEKKAFSDHSSALAAYEKVLNNLLRPQLWQQLCGKGSAAFEVIGKEHLKPTDDTISEGDYIRINIPGPGPGSGDGFDWVKVSLIKEEKHANAKRAGIKLVPCANPLNENDTPSHFFTDESSSTLTVELSDTTVQTFYHGRNEEPNNETGKVTENIRNTLVAAGALAGLSEIQWRKLLKGLLQ